MKNILKFFCRGIVIFAGLSSTLVYAYPSCFLSGANILVPKGTK